jgi:hypothetical protein
MQRLAVLALAAALGGCTPMQWVKADAGAAQIHSDEEECRQNASREASVRSWHYQTMAPILARDASGRPFTVWPSGAFADPYGNQLLEEHRLAQFCMESKGYRLAPATRP